MLSEADLGAVALAFSSLSLLALAVSLAVQVRQARIALRQTLATQQMELLRLAYEHSDLERAWGGPYRNPPEAFRLRTYMNLIFVYNYTNYVLRGMSSDGLRYYLATELLNDVGRECWKDAAPAFKAMGRFGRKRKFYSIVQSEYERLETAPERADRVAHERTPR